MAKRDKQQRTPAHPTTSIPKREDGVPGIRYKVSMPKPSSHNFEIEIELSDLAEEFIDIQMPAWTPGSYKIREFAKNISAFEARAGNGRKLKTELLDKQTWRISLGSGTTVRIRYRLYGFELSVRTPHLDDTHGFFQCTNILPYVVGHKDAPALLSVNTPGDWQVFCPLPRLRGERATFVAESYDVLGDAPVECGNHETRLFTVDGKRHEIVVWGWGNYDLDQWVIDFTKIVRQCKKTFGGLPYENYMFMIQCLPNNRGGLEHLNSQVSAWSSLDFGDLKRYQDFLSLISHEFFHTWNVKRIRPEILGPFDYSAEQYTESLWVMEGLTVYYEWVQLARAGIVPRERYFAALSEELNRWDDRPGNAVMSVTESSFLAWTKLYLADENFVNSGISYYLKGGLIGLLLDLEIRKLTDNKKSLDDVMRRLFEDYGWPKPGFPEGTIEQVVADIAPEGRWRKWFNYHLRSTKPLKFDAALKSVGLEVSRETVLKAGPHGKSTKVVHAPYLGWELKDDGRAVVVSVVRDGTPACDAGVSVKDQLLAIGEHKVGSAEYAATLLGLYQPGVKVRVTLFRGERLVQLEVQIGRAPVGRIKVSAVESLTKDQKSAQDAWLG